MYYIRFLNSCFKNYIFLIMGLMNDAHIELSQKFSKTLASLCEILAVSLWFKFFKDDF